MTAVLRADDARVKVLSWRELLAVIFLRVVVISAAVVFLSFFLNIDSVAFYALVAFGYIATIPYALWIKDVSRGRQVVPLQCVVDILLVTGLVYFTGGPRSELAMLYPLVFLSSGILAGPTMAIEISILGALFYALVVVLMSSGGVTDARGLASTDWATLGEQLGVRSFVFLCFGAAGAYISRRCRFADTRVEKYRDFLQAIFNHVGVGLVLTDRQGRILMVNPAACDLLRASEGALLNQDLHQFFDGELSLEDIAARKRERLTRLLRKDGKPFDARYQLAPINLPVEPGQSAVRGTQLAEDTSGYLLMFTDVTDLLQMQAKIQMAERIQAAARMASEIAHEIRNPLTAVAGSLELLDHLERNAEAGDEHSATLLRQNRSVLYSQVVRESQRMNQIIQRFLDHAEFTPESLKRLLNYEEEIETTSGAQR